jgi:hypothetical protein
MDAGYSSFKFRASRFDTSIVTVNLFFITITETGLITFTETPGTFLFAET